MLQQTPARAAAPDIDWRLLGPLLANAFMVHTVIGIIRVTTSYRTIELGLPVLWLGVIAVPLGPKMSPLSSAGVRARLLAARSVGRRSCRVGQLRQRMLDQRCPVPHVPGSEKRARL